MNVYEVVLRGAIDEQLCHWKAPKGWTLSSEKMTP